MEAGKSAREATVLAKSIFQGTKTVMSDLTSIKKIVLLPKKMHEGKNSEVSERLMQSFFN